MEQITISNVSEFVDLLDTDDPDVWTSEYCYVCFRRIPINPEIICTDYNYSSNYWYTGIACEKCKARYILDQRVDETINHIHRLKQERSNLITQILHHFNLPMEIINYIIKLNDNVINAGDYLV